MRPANDQTCPREAAALECDPAELVVERFRSIHEIDRTLWDDCLGTRACASWHALATAERAFRGHGRPEHDWSWHYVVVCDRNGAVVAATFFTTTLQKDDMLMRSAISRAVEERRRQDPYFLTSKVTMAGSGLSEGDHVFLDRRGPWRAALRRLIEVGLEVQEREGSDALVLRDLPGEDPELDAFMRAEGFVKIENLPSHHVDVRWTDVESLIAGLDSKRKRKLARQIADDARGFRVTIHPRGTEDPALAQVLYRLYRNVADRGLRINSFPLPESVFGHLLRSPAWEIGTLAFDPAVHPGTSSDPITCWVAHQCRDHDTWLVAGLDYRYVESHRTYKQLIFQVLERARQRGATRVHLGMTADLEKSRWGSYPIRSCLFMQSRTDYNASVLREIVAELGVGAASQ